MSESRPLISAICAVKKAVKSIDKDGRNDHHKYKYASAGNVMAAMQPALADSGIVISAVQVDQKILFDGAILAMTFEFHVVHESGDALVPPPSFTGMSSFKNMKSGAIDDKAANKCLVAAKKYFLLQQFEIPTGDYPDADSEGPAVANDTPASTLPGPYAPLASATPEYHRIVTAIWGCLGVAVDPNLNPWNEIEAMGQGDVLGALEGLPALKTTLRDSPDVKACNSQEKKAIGQLFTDIEAALNGRTEEDAA